MIRNNEIHSMQLFALPFAGGNSASFKKLERLLSPQIEFITVEYSGRLTRHQNPFITDYNLFLRDVGNQIKSKQNGQPYALFGYSLGSTLAYDLLREDIIQGYPVHVFACARGSIIRNTTSQEYANLPDDQFLEKMIELGGMDERILKNQRFLEIFMAPIRADYVIWKQYKFHMGTIPCNTSVIYSPEDPVSDGVEDWEKIVNGHVDYYELGVNHFFINDHWQDVANIVNSHLQQYL